MLTGRDCESDKITGLEAGVDDYLIKPFSPRELLARIKAVMRRCAPQHADMVVEIAGLRLDPASRRICGAGRDIELGALEFRMLRFFMTHPGRVYSRAQLLDEVWGNNVYVEERTVDVHIRRLRQALEPTGHKGLLETVRGVGLLLPPRASGRDPARSRDDVAGGVPSGLSPGCRLIAGSFTVDAQSPP